MPIREAVRAVRRRTVRNSLTEKFLSDREMICITTHIPPKESRNVTIGKRDISMAGSVTMLLISRNVIITERIVNEGEPIIRATVSEMRSIQPESRKIQIAPPKARIIIHICIIAVAEERTAGTKAEGVIFSFGLWERKILGSARVHRNAEMMFAKIIEVKSMVEAFESGYRQAAAVPEIKAGPPQQHIHDMIFPCCGLISFFLRLSTVSLTPAG